MSESSSPAQNLLSGAAAQSTGSQNYQLSDDLARLCLPREWKDSCRTLAWVNSVCFLFLVVGLVGLKPPRVIHRPLKEVAEVTPVVFTPPEEVPKTEPDVKPDEPDQPQDTPDVPQVATIVAAADPTSVAFAVPVQGAVAIASEAHAATPPPQNTHVSSAPKMTEFNPNGDGTAGGSYPPPDYSMQAQRRGYAGTVVVHIRVDPSGAISDVQIFKSSGYSLLDEAAVDVVKHKWHFPPGSERLFQKPFTFKPLGG